MRTCSIPNNRQIGQSKSSRSGAAIKAASDDRGANRFDAKPTA
jgi:hypothetical protein